MFTCTNCKTSLTWPYYTCTICTNPYLYLCIKCYKSRNLDNSFLNLSTVSLQESETVSITHNPSHDFIKISSTFEEDNQDFGDVSDLESSELGSSFDKSAEHDQLATHHGKSFSSSTGMSMTIYQSPLPSSPVSSSESPKQRICLPPISGKSIQKAKATFLNKKKSINITLGIKESPNLLSNDLKPLDEEIDFLKFMSKKGIFCNEAIDQFFKKYPNASCKRKDRNLKRMADKGEIIDDSTPVWDNSSMDVIPAKRSKNFNFDESISYSIPDYILDKEEMVDRFSSALADVGYGTKTSDFHQTDSLNDAEEHIAAISTTSMNNETRHQTVEEKTLRDLMIESYIIYQRERQRQKEIIKDHGLTGLKLTENDFSPKNNEDKIYNSLASICSKQELENFKAGVRHENFLRDRIDRLEKFKAYGVRTKTDQLLFEFLDVERKIDVARKIVNVESGSLRGRKGCR